MDRKIRFLAVLFIALMLAGCGSLIRAIRGGGGSQDIIAGPYVPAVTSPIKIQVVDVSNDTHKVFDVDVIGLLWSGLDESLKKRGMLWTKDAGGRQYTLEAHVVKYKKGSQPGRLVPKMGDTVLVVKCDLKEGGTQIATIESKRTISFGDMLLARDAWRRIFTEVAEDVIAQATRKL